MKIRFAKPLGILHVMALGTISASFGFAGLSWLQNHTANNVGGNDLASLGGIATGVGLGLVLLWRAFRPARDNLKTTVALYACWIGIFAWYWFDRFALRELHTLNPDRMRQDRAWQTIISVVFFLIWVCLFSLGPILRARKSR
jgi:hypothetical protein